MKIMIRLIGYSLLLQHWSYTIVFVICRYMNVYVYIELCLTCITTLVYDNTVIGNRIGNLCLI